MRPRPRHLLVIASTLATVTSLPGSAQAQSASDITFACPADTDESARARPGVPQAVPLAYPAPFGCGIYYGNGGSTPIEIEFTVTFPTRELTLWQDPPALDTDANPNNASELPDGVLRPFGLGRGFTWRAPFLHAIHPVAGSQAFDAPGFDVDNQQLRYTISVAPSQTTSLIFRTTDNFHYTDYNNHFPRGDHAIVLTARVGGQPILHQGAPAQWVVPVSVTSPNAPPLRVFPTQTSNSRVELNSRFTGFIAAGLNDHLTYTTARFPIQSSAYVSVSLPYWNGTAFVADGAYDPSNLSHIPALDLSRLEVSLVRRRNSGYGLNGPVLEEVLTGGTSSGPAGGDNAGKLVRLDPATLTLYGTFGALGLNGPSYRAASLEPGADALERVALRYSAPFSSAALALLDSGSVVPVRGCYTSDQTPTSCLAGRHTIGPEPWTPSTFRVGHRHGYSATEANPLGPGSDMEVRLTCDNTSGQDRELDLFIQMPADAAGNLAVDWSHILLQGMHQWGPEAAERYEIHVSTRPSDRSSPQDMSQRAVPTATSTDWVLCKGLDAAQVTPVASNGFADPTTISCSRDELVALGLDPAAVQEVRVRIFGQRPLVTSHLDASGGCLVQINGKPYDTMPSSVDEICDGGVGEKYDPFALTNVQGQGVTASFGSIARVSSVYADGDSRLETLGDNAEFSRRAIASTCLGSGFPNSCYYTVSDATIGSLVYFSAGLDNSGTAPIRTPIEYCATLPVGFVPLNLDDPSFNGRRLISVTGNHAPLAIRNILLPANRYQLSFDPGTRRVCLNVPESGQANDPYDAFIGTLAIELWGQLVPGAARTTRLLEPSWSYREDTVCAIGVARTSSAASAGGFDLGLVPDIRVTTTTTPDVIPANGSYCIDAAVDNRAFDESGELIQLNAGSARNSLLFFEIPRRDTPPSALYESIASPDGRVWVTRAPYLAGALPSATDLITSHTDPTTGFVLCAPAGAPCDAAALGAIGLDAEALTWVAVDFGELLVTDAQPRGVAPTSTTAPVNNPYRASLCLRDEGSAGSVLSSSVVFRSPDASSATATSSVTVTNPCPDGVTWAPEICDGLDNDCDGLIDEELPASPVSCGSATCLNAPTGVTTCIDGVPGDTCDQAYGAIASLDGLDDDLCLASSPASDLIVVYLIVQDAVTGEDAGSVRCWQSVSAAPSTSCDTTVDDNGRVVLKVYPELLCLAPAGGTP